MTGPERIRQDMPDHQTRRGRAERPRRFDEFLLAQRQELGPHQARHRHPAKAADHQHDQNEDAAFRADQIFEEIPEQIDHQQQQRQLRQRQKQVGDPHQHGVDAAPGNARYRADQGAGDNGDGHRRETDRERNASAVQHARQQVLAEIVGAERVLPRRRAEPRGKIDFVDRHAPDKRPEHNGRRQHRQDHHARNGHAMAAKLSPRLEAGRDAARTSLKRDGNVNDRRCVGQASHR